MDGSGLGLIVGATPEPACEHVYLKPDDGAKFYIYITCICTCILLAGVFSGLTLGLLSLDPMDLDVIIQGGSAHEKRCASRIRPLVKRHHMLLVTLLLCNAGVNESLPLFLDDMVPEVVAVLISVTAVLLFGEVIPQAICARYGLGIGAFFAPFVGLLMILLSPITYPLSKLLDCLLGENHTAYFRRSELAALVSMHGTSVAGDDNNDPLNAEEVMIIKGALSLREKRVGDCMTALEYVYMLPLNALLDSETIDEIIATGYSRIPVFRKEKSDARQLILVKQLLKYNDEDATPIKQIPKRVMPVVQDDTLLLEILALFRSGKGHMAGVLNSEKTLIGVITIEDVVEELLQEEIIDETDVFVDVQRRVKVARGSLGGTPRGRGHLHHYHRPRLAVIPDERPMLGSESDNEGGEDEDASLLGASLNRSGGGLMNYRTMP
eukprot:m.150207 g.150207  ORF g.150207 m.150207 type:complete len:437 (+) comp16877_c0_seq1:161-1471(+)